MSTRPTLLASAGLVVLFAVVGYYAHTARAGGIPSANTLTYSGTLHNEKGPLTGRQAIDFRLYDAREGGQERCVLMNPKDGYPLTDDGRFSIVLPEACVTAVSEHPQLWVEVRVAGTELTRSPLGAVPYAVEARRAATADSASGALEQRIAALEAQVSGKVAGIWFAGHPGDPQCASIMASDWMDVPDAFVEFVVDKPIRIWSSYAINIQPDGASGDEYLGTRIVIDDVGSTSSGGHFQPYSPDGVNATLTGSEAADLAPGAHTVKLQWYAGGAGERTWTNCPNWGDGYQGGRTLTVIGVYQ